MTAQKFTLSNPRKNDSIADWPIGGSRRGTAVFTHEANSRGERIGRTTTGKPKYTTYYAKICLVDGSDGKTHLLAHTGNSGGFLSVLSADMQHSDFSVFEGDDNFAEYLAMVNGAL